MNNGTPSRSPWSRVPGWFGAVFARVLLFALLAGVLAGVVGMWRWALGL